MKFFLHFLKNPKAVAAIKPSSRFLARTAVHAAQLDDKKCVVELGSGNGVFTKYIVEDLEPETVFFALEMNEYFVEQARENVPQAITYHGRAENIQDYLQEHGCISADCIISALPWATLQHHEQEKLMQIIHDSLAPGGTFLTIANVQGLILPSGRKFKKLLKRSFKKVSRTKIVWRNLMPSFVYICEK